MTSVQAEGSGSLVHRALSAPSAVGVMAWALPTPLVAVDALAAAWIWNRSWGPLIVVPVLYLAAAAWFVAATSLVDRLTIGSLRAATTVTAFALAGATWVGGSIWWIQSHAQADVSVAWGVAAGIVMQVVVGVWTAVVLFSRSTAHEAQLQALRARADLLEAIVRLGTVRAAARESLVEWIDDVLAPGVARLASRVRQADAETCTVVIAEVDRFREVTVRRGSHGMHPRASRLGLASALAASAAHHGHPDASIIVDPSCTQSEAGREGSALVSAAVVRIVGLVLDATDDSSSPEVTVARRSGSWQVHVRDVEADLQSLPMIEASARLSELDGRIEAIALRELVVEIPERRRPDPAVVTVERVRVPRAAAMTLAPITAVLVALLGGSAAVMAAATVASLSIGLFAAALLPDGPLRLGMALRILIVSALTALAIGGSWLLVAVSDPPTPAMAAYTLANAAGIAALLLLIVAARALIGAWEEDARSAGTSRETARAESASVAREIDDLRAGVAGIVHGRVQARLVVAAGRLSHDPLRDSDVEQACRAIDIIGAVDLPDLRRMARGNRSTWGSVVDHLADVSGLALDIRVDLPDDSDVAHRIAEIVREAVGNAIVHGAATRVQIEVEASGTGYCVSVRDDGLGPPGDPPWGLGCTVIDEASCGRWSLEAAHDGGARLVATVS
ncbi:MAG: hypothetical protein K9G24_10025 [Candidatus Nanopelagicales bacterium]|nr:hypothetical protein [Candidatus Nanopelagicales bacterium]MCF8536985.1 hypothetical protein [Candidatus Nanopelagicales bacterium]MCF8543404.1 hypothetical protein [Candidatus Nanopelagicales bacterium]MCF8556842.1 hypothetical protein [Candidatus Nanopelagicales bacterium]